ncbi:hypothetical protein G4G27_02305 [Sphingomonas sp. So64.6b]|uniref:hypothetical protein n=1 Tax=Sphingomonas sp. So64.6b TaxID=2997354 RepID=UPI0016005E9B|nr:hypothetical protein [Sphingomonas sp. So64.6b]QNA82975.1 hypothetical protein G4G27_02305 [Sphingomonas sp. So64.6b]
MPLFFLPIAAVVAAQAQPGTASTTVIYGVLAPVCTVEIATPAAVVSLDIRGAQSITPVTYHCNDVNGFTRQVSSQNGGALVRGTQRIGYRISQDGDAEIAIADASLAAPIVSTVGGSASVTGTSGMLSITVPVVPERLLAGDYTDVITIEITPN